MTAADRQAAIQHARDAIRAQATTAVALTIMRRIDVATADAQPPIAFLTTFARAGGDVAIVLAAGRNVVARSTSRYGRWPEPAVIESAQWLIECDGGEARVRDAASTNLSVLISGGALPARSLAGFGLHDLEREPGAIAIPHANDPDGERWLRLAEGDALRSCYATFVFAWL